VKTHSNQRHRAGADPRRGHGICARRTPSALRKRPRVNGAQQPEDVTGSVVWLLSDLSRFITGQLIPVNGGFVFN
jgi:NAD(P)-dependent dehydrogenase (short-subunit alcohol dehydrogenase family)